MKFNRLTMMILPLVFLSGCGATIAGDTYCDIASPLYFDSMRTAEWLMENDRKLLTDIVINNETHEKLCP